MASLRTRNAVILAKIESSEGVDAAPSASTDAILVEVPNSPFNLNPNLIQTNEATGSLDGAGPIVGGMKASITFGHFLKGSGTAGTAPEFGKLLKACGFAETLTGTAVPGSAEACGAGGSTTTAQLGSSASTTAQLYRGMPIALSSEVTGNSFISNYTTGKIATLTDTFAAIDADTNYQVQKNVLYMPASASIPSITIYMYLDGLLYKFVGCRGTFKIDIPAGGPGKIEYTFSGVISSKTDAAVPVPTFDQAQKPTFLNGVMSYNRALCAVSQLSVDCGNTVTFPDDPNAVQGFGAPIITSRRVTGNINPLESLVATRDIYSDFVAGTRRIIHARYGSSVGNRIGITIPQAQPTNQTPGDRNGLMEVGIPFEAVGQDSGMALCFY